MFCELRRSRRSGKLRFFKLCVSDRAKCDRAYCAGAENCICGCIGRCTDDQGRIAHEIKAGDIVRVAVLSLLVVAADSDAMFNMRTNG